MNKEYIIRSIEKLLNNEAVSIDRVMAQIEQNNIDRALKNVANRLIENYKCFQQGNCGEADFLVSLRNFMLSYQTRLRIDLDCSEDSLEKYGIYFEASSKEYYAVYGVPEYFPQKSFVDEAFINSGTSLNETKSKYCLRTNNFIKNLNKK